MHLETNLFEIFGFLPYGFLTNLVYKKKISKDVNDILHVLGVKYLLFFVTLYVNCFGRTMLYMCIEYHI